MSQLQLLLYDCGHLCYAATGKPAPNLYASDSTGAEYINAPCPQCPHPKPKRLPPVDIVTDEIGGGDYGAAGRNSR